MMATIMVNLSEQESIPIIREAVAEAEKPVLVYCKKQEGYF